MCALSLENTDATWMSNINTELKINQKNISCNLDSGTNAISNNSRPIIYILRNKNKIQNKIK